MSILSRLRGARAVATLAIAVAVAGCSSAATAPSTAPASGGAAASASGPLGTPVLVDPFISAGIATTVDTAAHAVDPSAYRATIPGAQFHTVYVVFALKPDTVGKVSMVMTKDDVQVLDKPLAIDYGTINSWGDFKVNFDPSVAMPLGIYKAVMTFEPTGAQVVQYFAVT